MKRGITVQSEVVENLQKCVKEMWTFPNISGYLYIQKILVIDRVKNVEDYYCTCPQVILNSLQSDKTIND